MHRYARKTSSYLRLANCNIFQTFINESPSSGVSALSITWILAPSLIRRKKTIVRRGAEYHIECFVKHLIFIQINHIKLVDL